MVVGLDDHARTMRVDCVGQAAKPGYYAIVGESGLVAGCRPMGKCHRRGLKYQ